MKLQFYEITWIDSECENGWDSPEKVDQPAKYAKSYGYLVKEGKDYITLASDYDEETKHFNRFMHIPLVTIKKKRKVKL